MNPITQQGGRALAALLGSLTGEWAYPLKAPKLGASQPQLSLQDAGRAR